MKPGRPTEEAIRQAFTPMLKKWFPGFAETSKKGKQLFTAFRQGWLMSKEEIKEKGVSNDDSSTEEW